MRTEGASREGKALVFAQIARLCPIGAEHSIDAAGGIIGNVLVQGTWLVACLDDALDGIGRDSTEASCMTKRTVDVLGRVALAEYDDAADDVAPMAGWRGAERAKKLKRMLPHALESQSHLIEIGGGGAGARAGTMRIERVEFPSSTARRELVSRDAGQIGCVHEQFAR